MPSLAALAVAAALAAPHVRAESIDTRDFIQDASTRSPIVRSLIDRLQQSDVIAYVRFAAFPDPMLEGRVGFLAHAGGRRYVLIEIACGRLPLGQVATFAHELQHVVEIAAASAIVDAGTLSKHYERIGMRMTDTWRHQTYETLAALEIGRQARREFVRTGDR